VETTVGHAGGDDERVVTGPLVALRCLERQGLVVQVVEPPFDLGPQPAWRLTPAGVARSLALLEKTVVRIAHQTTT
jgi:hypothetical protein